MYDYNSKIRYEIENNFISKKMSIATKRMKRLHEFRDELTQRWKHVVVAQIKYYNKKHLSKNFKIENLIMLSTKNLKQKKSNKKLFHKFIESFRVKKSVEKQTYRLIFFNIYRIHFVFHVSLIELYRRRKCDNDESFFSNSELINDHSKYKIKKILNRKIQNDKIFYKLKWIEFFENYNFWKSKHFLNNAFELRKKYDNKNSAKKKKSKKI